MIAKDRRSPDRRGLPSTMQALGESLAKSMGHQNIPVSDEGLEREIEEALKNSPSARALWVQAWDERVEARARLRRRANLIMAILGIFLGVAAILLISPITIGHLDVALWQIALSIAATALAVLVGVSALRSVSLKALIHPRAATRKASFAEVARLLKEADKSLPDEIASSGGGVPTTTAQHLLEQLVEAMRELASLVKTQRERLPRTGASPSQIVDELEALAIVTRHCAAALANYAHSANISWRWIEDLSQGGPHQPLQVIVLPRTGLHLTRDQVYRLVSGIRALDEFALISANQVLDVAGSGRGGGMEELRSAFARSYALVRVLLESELRLRNILFEQYKEAPVPAN